MYGGVGWWVIGELADFREGRGGWYFGHNACVLGLNFRAPRGWSPQILLKFYAGHLPLNLSC